MQPSRGFTIRLFLYGAVLLYLAVDLFWFGGPVAQNLRRHQLVGAEAFVGARARGAVAIVFGKPIYATQLERAARERLWLAGSGMEGLAPESRREARLAALNGLIDHELLRTKTHANQDTLPVDPAALELALQIFRSTWSGEAELEAALRAAGIKTDRELRYRLAARIQQLLYIRSRTSGETAVGETEAREWFEAVEEKFEIPERVCLRWFFLPQENPNLGAPPAVLIEAAAALKDRTKSFDEVMAGAPSARGRLLHSGPDWVTRKDLPPELSESVFGLTENEPALLASDSGWFLIEVTGREAAASLGFDEAREEVMAALRSAKWSERTRALREAIRHTENVAVHLFPEAVVGN